MLTSIFPPSDKLFVGNNGAGQYLVFVESLEPEQAEAALFQIQVALEQGQWNQAGQRLDHRIVGQERQAVQPHRRNEVQGRSRPVPASGWS